MLENYLLYMQYLNKKLGSYFERQAPYICCKEGCAACCQNGEYPFSKLEFDFLMFGFMRLDKETQIKITEKIKRLKEEKKNSTKKSFTYECPFLENNKCSVYDFRGIICRSFGLISIRENQNSKIPFCAFNGLNYSNVLDTETKIISMEKYEKLGIDVEPLAFNTGYHVLTGENVEEAFNIKFGEKKALIDFFN